MKIIDNKNLDEWLFDHFEGNLNSEDTEILMRFLNKNPALKADYDTWKGSYIKEPEIIYPGTEKLLKSEKMVSNSTKWILSGIVCIVLLIVYLLFNQKPSDTQTQIINTKQKSKSIIQTKNDSDRLIRTEIPVLNKTIIIKKSNVILKNNIYKEPNKDSLKNVIPQTTITHSIVSSIENIPISKIDTSKEDTIKREIVKPNDVKSVNEPIIDSSKIKKERRKKEMKIIRLTNSGF